MAASTILVVEDDPAIRRGIVDALAFAGFAPLEAADADTGLALALEAPVDLVLLDVMLPARALGDGFDLLAELREARPALPVIMVTARGSEDDRVRGLRAGADDYVAKPFSALELLARVEAVLRRSPERTGDIGRLVLDGTTADLERREVRAEALGTAVPLSERESAILRHLAAHRDRAIDRRELLHRVWGLDPRGLETRTVDMQIARLREKLPAGWITTVRGKGYELAAAVEVDP